MSRQLPNLKQLRAFEAAVRCKSFKAAAAELHVTQAAISHQIKALEEDFGQPLFHRTGREVIPTGDSRAFANELTTSLDRIAAAALALRSAGLEGKLNISATVFYVNRIVMPFLYDFEALYPKINLTFDYSYGLADFQTTNLHAGLRHGKGDWEGLESILIHWDRVAPVCTPSLIAKAGAVGAPTDWSRYRHAAVKGQADDWENWYHAAGIEPVPSYHCVEFAHRGQSQDFALAGHGIALVDLCLVQHELESGMLILLHPKTMKLDRGVHLVFPTAAREDARLTAFAGWLKDVVENIQTQAGLMDGAG